ncbi:AMP-binding protein [Patulibacter brassicae]|uniref:Acyl-CoA synthetase n=1 Tax=Patulibacter brassicae TaxID=1705717 RepID=A0ABU4VK93_9ACTN|nr:AMP-binding protein [Patulibacter brassicae]MDX8151504.1 AMP-binding protein [Patulibacter brassicae]
MSTTGDAPAAATSTTGSGAGPGTLPGLLLQRATTTPDAVALRQKHHGLWRETTWGDYARRVAAVAAGLARLGVAAGDRVAIHAENRIEWPLVDLAVQALGAMTVGIYPTSPASEVEYLLAHSRTSVLVAEDEEQLDKALEVRDRLPELRAIVVVDPRGVDDAGPGVLPWSALEDPGADPATDGPALASAVAALDPAAPAIVVYTSGTTGPPKGALLGHANLDAAGRVFAELYPATPRDELLSYLPLCHVAERLLSVVGNLHSGYVVSFGEGGEAFVEDLREVQPTFFLGVPRVWEKLHAGIETRIADSSWLKRTLYGRLTAVRDRAAARRRTGRSGPADRVRELVAEALVHRALRDRLGLRRVRHALSGAAPISPRILEALWAIGIPVREAYGQTENTAIATSTPAGDVRIGTVGVACPGGEVRIAEDGEILTRSDGVFLGYLDDPEATRAAVDAQGWLHTGDVGELDADGHLRITDRKKDIIITAGGKNVSPSEVENRLKVSPFVREAIVVGDRRKFLVALIGIEQDTVGDWAGRHGVSYTTYADLSRRPEVRALLQGVVDEANGDLAQVEQVKRFALLDKELDHEDGELTATQKVRRAAIERRFADLIEELYAGSAA